MKKGIILGLIIVWGARGFAAEASRPGPGEILVSDNDQEFVLAVDPISGDRRIISGHGIGEGPALRVGDCVLDSNGRLIVSVVFAVLSVDLDTGNRTLIAGDPCGFDRTIWSPYGIALESSGAIILCQGKRGLSLPLLQPVIMRVEPVTGDITVLSSDHVGSGPLLNFPYSVEVAKDGTILVANRDAGFNPMSGTLLGVDPVSGDRFIISGEGVGEGPEFPPVGGIHVDSKGDVYVSTGDRYYIKGAIFRVDLATGNRTLVSDNATGTGPLFPYEMNELCSDNEGNLIAACGTSLYEVNPVTGDRRLISDYSKGTGPYFDYIDGIDVIPEPRILYVDDDASNDPGPGDPAVSDPLEDGSQAHPFDAIQEAIDVARCGDTVIALDGTYTGTGNHDSDFRGKAIAVRSANGPESCIIDCQGAPSIKRRGFYLHSGETHASVIDGFTIINGTGRDEEYTGGFGVCGGAIACVNSGATVRNCIITKNMSRHGAGVFAYRSDVLIEECAFHENHNTGYGSAISSWESVALIRACSIEENTSEQGCAVYAWGAGAKTTIQDCDVVSNSGDMWVGGIGLWGDNIIADCIVQGNYGRGVGGIYAKANCTIWNCVISDNTTMGSAGGIDCEAEISYPIENFAVIANCTIVNNHSEGRTGGVDLDSGLASAAVTNCIVWGNTGRWYDQIHTAELGEKAEVTFCDVQGGWPGEGNMDVEPLFIDPGNGDLRLLPDSPCIDAGDNNSVPPDTMDLDGDGDVNEPIPWDLDGNPRIVDGDGDGITVVDMGAYEAAPCVACCFGVNYLRIAEKGKDLDIKGTFKPIVSVDLSVDDVTFIIDDGQGNAVEVFIPAGSFEADGKAETQRFKYASPKKSKPEIKARFDFRKCKFELKVKKIPTPEKLKGTTLGVALYVGNNVGEEVLEVHAKEKHLEYKRKQKVDCCRE